MRGDKVLILDSSGKHAVYDFTLGTFTRAVDMKDIKYMYNKGSIWTYYRERWRQFLHYHRSR
jgi:hypothetical protein